MSLVQYNIIATTASTGECCTRIWLLLVIRNGDGAAVTIRTTVRKLDALR